MLDDLGLSLHFSTRTLLTDVLSPTLQHVLAQQVDSEYGNRQELDAVHHNVDCKALGITGRIVRTEDLRADGVSDGPCTEQSQQVSCCNLCFGGERAYMNVPVTVTTCLVLPPVLPVTSARFSTATAPNP